MNIAICDDEKVFLKQLHMKINSLKIHNCQISEFTSGQELLSNFVKGMYEIIILDVEMPGLNGLETAERIRQTDKSVIISFLTNYSEFAVKGYEVGAFRYILKNQLDYAYMEQLLSVFDEYNQKFRTFTFTNRNLTFSFKLIHILYFEVHGRKVTIFTTSGEIEYYGEFAEICSELQEYHFVQTNKGMLVNLEHIQQFVKNDIILSNGKKIQLGRTYKDKIISDYLEYTSER